MLTLPYNLGLAARSITIFLPIKEGNLKTVAITVILSRIILLVDNVSATLCDKFQLYAMMPLLLRKYDNHKDNFVYGFANFF